MIDTPPIVLSTEERMVFDVLSRTNPAKRYRVDLLAYAGTGECACKDWATRRGPAIKAGAEPGTRATMCWHVLQARRHFTNALLRDMALQETTPPRS